jgi:hypothetical protein
MFIAGFNKTELPGNTVKKNKREIMFIRTTEGRVSFLKLGVSGRIISKYTSKKPQN